MNETTGAGAKPGGVKLGPGMAAGCTIASSHCGRCGTRVGDDDMIGVGRFWAALLDSVKAAGTTMCKTNLNSTFPRFAVTTLPIDGFFFHLSPSKQLLPASKLSTQTQVHICTSIRVQHCCFNNGFKMLRLTTRRLSTRHKFYFQKTKATPYMCHDVESPS